MNQIYDFSVDIWSVGCIFAELLGMMKESFDNFADRVPLFPGSSCEPLSPGSYGVTEEAKQKRILNDQLNVIFEVIGTPKLDDPMEFLNDKESVAYVRNFPARERAEFKDMFPGCGDKGIQLLY